MFNFGSLHNSTADFCLIALMLLWGFLLFGGFIFGKKSLLAEYRMPTWTRIGSSLVLVLAAWFWWFVAYSQNDGVVADYTFWIAVGMSLGFVGDLFMANLLPFLPEPILGGIAFFGLGHIAYIVAFFIFAVSYHFVTGLYWAGWVLWLLIALVGWYFIVWWGSADKSPLRLAALPYSLLLASTAGFATGLAFQNSAIIPTAVGAAFFLISDSLIAVQLFNPRYKFPLIADAVWLTYGPAQLLIVYSTLGVMAFPNLS